jgi:phosphohistidine swiveling domain-containing protein
MPPNICDPADLDVVRYPQAQPNFVTRQRIEGTPVTPPSGHGSHPASLENAIVLLESADPGYDWIFAHRPKGIVTKYGGAGSHMTIRCAAFGIPAAIGCGEKLFANLAGANSIVLDCQRGIIAPLTGRLP